jgi:hypothetical protein
VITHCRIARRDPRLMGHELNQDWFEMRDLRKPRLTTSTWVPLFSRKTFSSGHKFGEVGFSEEFFVAIGIILPVESHAKALQVSWMNAKRHDNHPYVERGIYYTADHFTDDNLQLKGIYAVLEQSFDGAEPRELHLHQDLALGLGLLREGDSWLRPEEDYLDVARLNRDKLGKPDEILIRAEHLRDFLAGKNSGLLWATFRSRRGIFANNPNFTWNEGKYIEEIPGGNCKGFLQEIDESGSPYGSGVAVFKTWRTDVDYGEDIPVFPPAVDSNIAGETRTFRRVGKKLFLAIGDMFRNEWLNPAEQSPRLRGDRIESTVHFILDSSGNSAVSQQLINESRWLWFRPSVMTEIAKRRGAALGWYSENTGFIKLPCHSPLHFGQNPKGLINVFAKDIGLLPEFVQKIWAGHNVSPDGPVSPELVSAQMECKPARTKPPELLFVKSLEKLRRVSSKKFGESLLKDHPAVSELLKAVNRFQSVDHSGMFQLCKEITRVVVERLNVPLLKRLMPTVGQELGSIKRLAKVIEQRGADGKELTKVLVGVYELRLADAHLPSQDLEHACDLLGISSKQNFVENGKVIILQVANAIDQISEVVS